MAEPRNLVICLDGTSNEPEQGATNVARIYDVAVKDDTQLVYYDPGVGTLGARAAMTPMGQALSRAAGLVAGYGIRDNIEQAYTWLSQNYRRNDRIYVFGFSRGAYTARALTGMLRTVGLVRPGSENLAPYALKLYAKSGHYRDATADPDSDPDQSAKAAQRRFWVLRADFRRLFGNPDFPHPFDTHRNQVHFLGVWDTVKSVGWLNLRGHLQVARWPFTARITNVGTARHALAIDEKRRFYAAYRFDAELVAADPERFREVWFAGVHSDVGGQFADDHRLSDIAFGWMANEACLAGLRLDAKRFRRLTGVPIGSPPAPGDALGTIHTNSWMWWLLGGWRPRQVLCEDLVAPSALERTAATAVAAAPYRPELAGRPTVLELEGPMGIKGSDAQ
ncbi:DUF2235 domain-containing protein [Mycolicibacterium sp.]|uniref:DUF2235 domain-containing protein n=1 Tax=Mycolicibacterium sp. TaxID=2320850 RepID=UPI0028A9438C|nr:DUF2235 domain-containing protein [Mycolicibacterium sp.]